MARGIVTENNVLHMKSSEPCAVSTPLRMKKGYTLGRRRITPEIGLILVLRAGPPVRSRMPFKHHCLSLAGIGEARREECDPGLASRCPCPPQVFWLVYLYGITHPLENTPSTGVFYSLHAFPPSPPILHAYSRLISLFHGSLTV